ncbi:MAG: hypothetical protein H6732_12105 [Alphaproteobacteria bacterium]|nr:hypothetical protein [Alphaproteobacteria bacterium]
MTCSRAYIAACGYCLPLVVGASALVAGAEHGLAVAVAGVAALFLLVTGELVLGRIHLAARIGQPAPSALAAARFGLPVPLALALTAWLGPAATLAGMSSLALGAAVLAAGATLRAADVTRVARPLELLG